MKRIIVLFIAFWFLPYTVLIGQKNNTQLLRINPIELQQMDLFQLEMMGLAEKIIIESIKMQGFESFIQDGMGIHNLQVEIEFSITSNSKEFPYSTENFRLSPQKTQSVMQVPNNFVWIKLDNQKWKDESVTPVPSVKFNVRNWKGKIEPGVSNYY